MPNTPPTTSGEFPSCRLVAAPAIDAGAVRRLKTHLAETLRPPVKTRAACPQQEGKVQATRALVTAFAELEQRGWSLRATARFMQCSPAMLFEMLHGTRRVADWVPWRLPPIARAVFARELAATIDESALDMDPPSQPATKVDLPSQTGTG